MVLKERKILSPLSWMFLLIIYISFFIVQLFFNFDIANSHSEHHSNSSFKNNSVNKKYSKSTNISTQVKKTYTRLNKRFQQENIEFDFTLSIEKFKPVAAVEKFQTIEESISCFTIDGNLIPRAPPAVI
jgi:hypothetical protein